MPIHDWKKVPAGLFHHFHHGWTAALSNALNAGALPEGYYALSEQAARGPIPDVITLQHRLGHDVTSPSGGVAEADAPPRAAFIQRAEPETYAAKANRIAIRHPLGDIVAVIEIVSPGNKESRHAIRAFVDKAVAFLRQEINLLIIDLLPPTPRDPNGIHRAIWEEIHDEPFELPASKPLSYAASFVKTAYVEPRGVGDELPSMPIFLGSGIYVPAPLEPTYMATWMSCPEPMKQLVLGSSAK
jgi:hypothetical protein